MQTSANCWSASSPAQQLTEQMLALLLGQLLLNERFHQAKRTI
jgi:hypothetical protein